MTLTPEPLTTSSETPVPRSGRGWLSRRGLVRVGLLLVLIGAVFQIERYLPIGQGRAQRLASEFLTLADPSFRPAEFRSEVLGRDVGRGERECWEVSFFDRRTGQRFKGFYVYVYRLDGLCVLSHVPRFGALP